MTTRKRVVFDRMLFLKLLSTLSLKDLMKLEFRIENKKNWETMVVCEDEQKPIFLCKVCKVFQYGDKNLLSHLGGKKHCCKMESVQQLYLPKDSGTKITTNNINNEQNQTSEANNVENLKDKEKREKHFDTINKSVFITKQNKLQLKTAYKQSIAKPKTNKIVGDKSVVNASKTGFSINAASNEGSMQISKVSIIKKATSGKFKNAEEKTDSTILPTESTNLKPAESFFRNKFQKDLENNINIKSHIPAKKNFKMQTNIIQTTLSNLVKEQTNVDALSTVFQPNIVIKPLSEMSSMETKISCVPISKLISSNQPAELKLTNSSHDNNAISQIELSKKIRISNQKEGKCDENYMVRIQNCVDYQPTFTNSKDFTFESTSNVTTILGLLGVEYVIKIVKDINDRAPRFKCSLCNIATDELSMHNHLLSFNHRLKFCEKHFPTAVRQYKQYIAHVPEHYVFKVLSPILEKLAMAIEKHHGRECAYLCYECSFTKNQQNIISTVLNRRHASEVLGPAFTHIVDTKDIDILIGNASNNTLPTESSIIVRNTFDSLTNRITKQKAETIYAKCLNLNEANRLVTVDDETHKHMVDVFLRNTRHNIPLRLRKLNGESKRGRSRSNSADRKRKRSQWNIERKSLSPLRDGDIWQAYRHMVDQNVRELNAAFDLYNSDPEKHPLYKEEWEIFWKRRKDELIAAGVNYRSYNYQNEWILYFKARLEILYNHDIENIKIKCRERLFLPMNNDELSNSKYHVHISDNLFDCVSLDKTHKKNHVNTTKDTENTENINIIHVLRLLTALENHLGSLGPSITELLAKSLQIIKLHPDNVNVLLLTNENCAILETAKEKFIGLIVSKLLDQTQERALKKAVHNTEELLKFATKVRNKMESSTADPYVNIAESLHRSINRVNTNILYKKQNHVGKTELAAKLASSLISQGKTSINQEQLQQIVQVYSHIEQQKHREPTSPLQH